VIPVVPGAGLLVVAVVVTLLPRRLAHLVAAAATAAVGVWAATVPAGTVVPASLLGFEAVVVAVDPMSRIMALIFTIAGTAAVGYAAFTDASARQTGFALSYVATALGAVLAGDWLTLIIFWELMAVGSTLLVFDHGPSATRPGFRYALYHAIGGSILMVAIVWHYTLVGSFLFDAATGIVGTGPQLLALVGMGVNVGFIGLHTWIPKTYPIPHVAASVFLSVFTTKTGVYGLARAFPDGQPVLIAMGVLMALVGVSYALIQTDMRRLLSYHIISQVGYMLVGIGIGGAKQLGGIGRAVPVTAVLFTVAALSITGFPGFAGFISKGMITQAANYNGYPLVFYALLLAGVGTFMSFIKFGVYAFWPSDPTPVRSAPVRGHHTIMGAIAVACVAIGLQPQLLFDILPGSAATAKPFTVGHLAEGFILAGLGLGGFVLTRAPLNRLIGLRDVDAITEPAVFRLTHGVVRLAAGSFQRVDTAVVAGVRRSTRVLAGPLRSGRSGLDRLLSTGGAGLQIGEATLVVLVSLAVVSLVVL
jgi:multicomponent Na+:H+ antiporter subunit D